MDVFAEGGEGEIRKGIDKEAEEGGAIARRQLPEYKPFEVCIIGGLASCW